MASVLQDPALPEQAKFISTHIKNNHSANPLILAIVHERLLSLNDERFASLKHQLREKYLNGEISIQEFGSQFHSELENRNWFIK